ncbi:MAG TPA: MG2 domain-containing protein, partial [Planctomycetota bacterium]|nr:MG2 domain-containing protein [Planctomycetota bacterium]
TDARGLARLEGFAPAAPCESWECRSSDGYVVATTADDRAVVGINAYDPDLAPWRFDMRGAWDQERAPLAAAVFTERGIYRPGEPLYAKAIVRRGPLGALAPAAGDSARWIFRDREDGVLADTVVRLSEFGTTDREFRLAPSLPLGHYTVEVQLVHDGAWQTAARTSYQVAEYRPPEFLVDVAADDRPRLSGDTADAHVSARYLFGAPMANALVHWHARRRLLDGWELRIPGTDDFIIGNRSYGWFDDAAEPAVRVLTSATDTLDEGGRLDLRIPLEASAGRAAQASLVATVTDANRQTVSAAASFTVHPAEFYVGARQQGESWFWTAGTPVSLDVIAVRPDGERVAGVEVSGVIVRREWHQARRLRDGTLSQVGGWVSDTVATCTVRTAADPAACTFTPPAGGSYVVTLRAADAAGREAVTSFVRWASGRDWVPWNDQTQLKMDIIADRERYAPGDTATLLFASPFTDAEAWITVERERVLESRRIRVTSGTTTLKLPITEAHAPNVFVSMIVVRGRSAPPGPLDDPGRPTMRVGYAELRVTPEVKRLNVDVAPLAPEYRPGDTAAVRIAVRDAEGRGHRAEVTLWAVDQGVLALTGYRTPDPLDLLYATRGLGMRLASNLATVAPQVPEGEKGRREPGGGGGGDLAGILRSRFQTTAFFLGSVITDANGDAVARAKLPDNLTTFRVMAVAVTAGDRYGSGESDLLVSRPLVARPALPRFVREGDRFTAGVVLNSRMGGRVDARVEAKADGIELRGRNRQDVRLEGARPGEARFEFRAQAGDSARFTFSARAGREADAVATAVPVKPFYHPLSQTVAGLLADTASTELVLDDDVDPARSVLDISFGTSPLAAIAGARNDLRLYPYACTEQIASVA